MDLPSWFVIFVNHMNDLFSAYQLKKGQKATISKIKAGDFQTHLMELGFIENKDIELLFKLPWKGPVVLKINQSVFSLRKEEAEQILIQA